MTTITPKVKWAERQDCVYVTIDAPVKKEDATVKVESDKISFEGKDKENKQYSFNISLFKEIDATQVFTDFNGRYPRLKLIKKEEGYWNFLLKDKKKEKFVETDWTLWKDEDEADETEEDSNKFGQFDMNNMGGMNGMGGMGGMGGMDMNEMMRSMGGGNMGGMNFGDDMDDLDDLKDEGDEESENPNTTDETEETKLNSVD